MGLEVRCGIRILLDGVGGEMGHKDSVRWGKGEMGHKDSVRWGWR